MNSKLIIILFCLVLNFAWGGDTLISFHGSRIMLPVGYGELSKDQLKTFKSSIFDRQIMTVYEKKSDLNGLRRILIYYDTLTGTKNLKFEKIVEIKQQVIKESGLIFNHVKIDEAKHCAFGKTIIPGDTSIFGFSVDEYGIMGIQFDNSNGITRTDEKEFESLIISIIHNSPYQYIPEESPKAKKAKKEMEKSGLLMTFGFIAMILVWIIRKYVTKDK